MLEITIPGREIYNERTNEFIEIKTETIQLEHSLISLSKWESKWKKPFLDDKEKTFEETLDYVKCMTLTKNVNPDIYYYLTKENVETVNAYIADPMTATWFTDERQQTEKSKKNSETVTAELIYYWMIALQIPIQFEKWHLNRLLTLIRVCNIKNEPPKKMSKREIMEKNKALNARRRAAMNSKG